MRKRWISRTHLRQMAMVLVLTVTALGCGPGGDEADGDGSDEDGYPMTLESFHGEITIQKKPTRVVSTSFAGTTYMEALGLTPVAAYSASEKALSDMPWLAENIDPDIIRDDLYSDGYNVQKYLDAKPDLILDTRWMPEKDYRELSKIATVWTGSPEETELTWRDNLMTLGKILGESDKAKQVIADAERKLSSVRDDLKGLNGKTYQSIWIDDQGGYNLVSKSGAEELGLKRGENVPDPELIDVGASARISGENLNKLNADVFIFWDDGDNTSTKALRAFQDDPRSKNLPAVRNDAVLILDSVGNNSLRFLPESIDWVIENIVPDLMDTSYAK